jgi:hypothetical protein
MGIRHDDTCRNKAHEGCAAMKPGKRTSTERQAMKRNMRWYDKYPKLAKLLEGLKDIRGDRRDEIISGVMLLIKQNAPNLLERYVLDFPLDIKRRRWYDCDPYLWLIFNGLQYASKPLIEKATKFLAGATIEKPALKTGPKGKHRKK